jgi:K+-sensing histidine kinase KdpD
MQLLGLPGMDLQHSTWISRVDPRDRSRFVASWEGIKSHGAPACNDYRFQRSDGKTIWVRDVSGAYPKLDGASAAIISTYTDVSDLKKRSSSRKSKPRSTNTLEAVIGPVVHDIRNNLHAIRLEIDLLLMDFGATLKTERLYESVERVNRSLDDLREYLVSPAPQPSVANPKLLLDEILGPMKEEFERRRVNLDINQLTAVPSVWIDSKQFRAALERVLEFCGALLDRGGELGIEVANRKAGTADHLELAVTVTSVSSCEVDEKDVFRPFLKVNNRQIGLGMGLARQILRRNQSDIRFVRQSSHRGRISILLKLVQPDS